MKLSDFFSALRHQGIVLWVADGRLQYRAPPGTMTPELRAAITERMPEVMEFLQSNDQRGRSGETRLPAADRTGDLPLSFAQERLWFMQQVAPTSTAYHVHGTVYIRGGLNVHALQRSIDEIFRRHETLRTTFVLKSGSPLVAIAPPEAVPVQWIDLEPGGAKLRADRLQGLQRTEVERVFDLEKGPLVRVCVARLSADESALLLTMHHIISDGWSVAVLVNEFVKFYEAFSTGREAELADFEWHYVDYAVWQRECLKGAVLRQQLDYWKERLAGARVLEIPTDRPRPAVQSHEGSSVEMEIHRELVAGLRELGRQQVATLFMVLSAAFKVLLWRYTGQEDIVVGSPIANRNRKETEKLIGFFVNTLALRTDLSGDPSFLELLEREREVTLGAYDHQEVPFEKVVADLGEARDLSRSPLFQVAFALQNTPTAKLQLAGLEFEVVEVEQKTAKFDLTLALSEEAGRLRGRVEYATQLYDRTTIERFVGHWEQLLGGIVRDPRRKLSELEVVTAEERRRLLQDWNATGVAYPRDKCLHELFEQQAGRTPHQLAVVFEEQRMTYAELNEQANQLAHYLMQQGVGAETLVGICMERGPELIVGLLGILKAGGAYVPLDPAHPAERLSRLIGDAGLQIILIQDRFAAAVSGSGSRTVLSLDRWSPNGQPLTDPQRRAWPENLAYVIHTSGSTGTPKGAMNTHKGICNRLQWMQATYQLTQSDVVLQKTPFTFDVSVWEFFWPLLTGASLILARPGGHQDPAYLLRLIDERQVTTVHFVPAMLAVFLDEVGEGRGAGLKRIFCSGEALPYEATRRCHQRLSAELHNLYGPTEAAVDVTHWACPKQAQDNVVPIGKPIANTQVYIVDSSLQPVPAGVVGEIYLGGVGLGRGYLNRADLTAEKFVPNPFSDHPGERLYRTGDLGRFLANGNIEFIGRIDYQVKVRGCRIELGEIESALREHAAIKEAVVMTRELRPGDKVLTAYIVPQHAADAVRLDQLHTLPNGLKLAQFHRYETDLFYKEIFEDQTYLKHGIVLFDGACVFDVGANIGLFSLFVAQQCANARIYAFEPSPPAWKKLRTNLERYGLNARALACGLSDRKKTAPLCHYPAMTAMSGVYAEAKAVGSPGTELEFAL